MVMGGMTLDSIPGRGKKFSLLQNTQMTSGAQPSFLFNGNGVSISGDKEAGA